MLKSRVLGDLDDRFFELDRREVRAADGDFEL
jgi:hypothetical protein